MATYSPSHPSFLMSSSAASPLDYGLGHQEAVNNSPNTSSASWDHHYQRRGRTRERFDYPSSEDFDLMAADNTTTTHPGDTGAPSPLPSQHRQHASIGPRSNPRPRSADSRPQYHNATPRSIGGTPSSSAIGARDRAAYLNMFHPGGSTPPATGMGTGTARSPRSAPAARPDVDAIRYYPSDLPRYNAVVHDDAIFSREQTFGHVATTSASALSSPRRIGNGGGVTPGTVGRSLTPTRVRYNGQPFASPLDQQGLETAIFMVPGNPYESTVGTDPRLFDRHSPHITSGHIPRPTSSASTNHRLYDKERRYYDYVRENLIMFGDGFGRAGMAGDAPSVGTGLSQEELLQRKRREETWRKRKDKRLQQHPQRTARTNRVVNLPSSLFSPHSSRQQQQQQQLMQQQQQQVQQQVTQQRKSQQTQGSAPIPRDGKSMDEKRPGDGGNGTNQVGKNTGEDDAFQPSFSNSGIGMTDYTRQTAASPKQDPPNQPRRNTVEEHGNGDDDESANSSNNNKGAKGIRASMVRRQRSNSKTSSAGRRWKIIPNLSRSKSESTTEDLASPTTKNFFREQGSKADPPAGKGSSSSALKRPRDPPPSANSAVEESFIQNDVPEYERFNSNPDGNVAPSEETIKAFSTSNAFSDNLLSAQPLKDDFDRFMDEPDLLSPQLTRSVSFDPGKEDILSAEEYLTVHRGVERTPTGIGIKRPTYAEFTPKSDYPRQLLSYGSGQKPAKERSPTSVMDFHTATPLSGVRWSETLTQQEFVTPQSAKLDPSSDHRVRKEPSIDPPKSILRKRSPPGASMSPTELAQQIDIHSSAENDDCPSDESPTKPGKAERDVRFFPTLNDSNELIASAPQRALAFVDEMGRSVSPIFGASGSQSTDQDQVVVAVAEELKGVPKWNNNLDTSFDKNIPIEFQEALLSGNQIFKRDDDSGQLSDSYVNFIEAVASVVIQTKVRQFLSSRRFLKLRQQPAAHTDLSAARRVDNETEEPGFKARDTLLARRSQTLAKKARNANKAKVATRQDVALDFFALAAIRIQAAFRGWWVRDCHAVDSYCASMIQKSYRGHICRCRFSEALYSVILVQSAFRRFLAMDLAVTRMYCIVRIQSVARGFLVRKRMYKAPRSVNRSDVYEIAATMIQAQWRSFACEMQFLRAYEDILVVQSVVRGWITRRLLRSWLKAHKMSTSGRLQGSLRRKSATRPTPHGNAPGIQLQKVETPSPKKPSKRIDISPSYVHHIEYMRKTLGSENTQVMQRKQNAQDIESGQRRLFQEHIDQGATETLPLGRNVQTLAMANLATRKMSQEAILDVLPNKEKTVENRESKAMNYQQNDPPSWAGRSEIEQRRKRKELEAKAKEEEERRRRDTQAAELAELEYKRKRMALKADARQKRLGATEQAAKEGTDVSTRMNLYAHNEEKKENDSVTIQSPDADALLDNDFPSTHNKGRESIAPPGARSALQKSQATSRAANIGTMKDFDSRNGVEQPAKDTSVPPKSNEVRHLKQGMKPAPGLTKEDGAKADAIVSISRKGGIVAERMRQMLLSIESGASHDSEARDLPEKNTSVDKPRDLSATSNISNPGGANLPAEVVSLASDEEPVILPVEASSEPVVKRIAATSTTYGDEMRSQRSEAEQKRIDDIQAIFQKAGLMSRIKKAA